MRFRVKRHKYNDEFEFLIVKDKTLNEYRVVNLTSKTLLTFSYRSKEKVIEALYSIKEWDITKIED